jgi:hypothetical protein
MSGLSVDPATLLGLGPDASLTFLQISLRGVIERNGQISVVRRGGGFQPRPKE